MREKVNRKRREQLVVRLMNSRDHRSELGSLTLSLKEGLEQGVATRTKVAYVQLGQVLRWMGRGQLSKTRCGNISCGLFGVLRILEKRVSQDIDNICQLGIGNDLATIC